MNPEAITLTIVGGTARPAIELPDFGALRVLKMTLSKQPFEVMVTGEKQQEYRSPSDWMMSRLYDTKERAKDYDAVFFRNGYQPHQPWFLAEFLGWEEAAADDSRSFSNGLVVPIPRGTIILHLGEILSSGNLPGCPDKATGCGQCNTCRLTSTT
jgi:hypothetical protein